jgi:hypothetical protein
VVGVVGLLFMWMIFKSGGEWYLGVSAEEAPAAASACLIAAGIYVVYLLYCGLKLTKATVQKDKIADDD